MKKALLIAPMGSVHRQFNRANINALQSLGFKVELAANFSVGEGREKQNQDFVTNCEKSGIHTHNLPFERKSLLSSWKLAKQLKELIIRERYDLVHTHTETGGLILKLCGPISSKKVYTPHGMSFYKGSSIISQLIYRPLERWLCSKNNANLGMNQEEIECLREWNAQSAYFVHGIGLNLDRMQSPVKSRFEVREVLGLNDDDIIITSVGDLIDRKNHLTILKALALCKNDKIKYIICGVGPTELKLKKSIHNLGLNDKAYLLGYRKDIPDVLGASDIFIFPSIFEGMPVAVLEAMGCGLPIICSDIRGQRDIIKNNINGYLCQPYDVVGYANYIETLAADNVLRNKMGKYNIELVKNFSIDSVTSELRDIYASVMQGH